ncbi:hypothetical protein [Streptomyces sp. 900105245]
MPAGPPGTGGLPFESREFEVAEDTVPAFVTDGMVGVRDRDVDEGVCEVSDGGHHSPHLRRAGSEDD